MIIETEFAVNAVHQLHNTNNFIDDLIFAHEDVRIILGEGTHTHEAVESAAEFVTMNKAQFCPAQWQFTITVQAFVIK